MRQLGQQSPLNAGCQPSRLDPFTIVSSVEEKTDGNRPTGAQLAGAVWLQRQNMDQAGGLDCLAIVSNDVHNTFPVPDKIDLQSLNYPNIGIVESISISCCPSANAHARLQTEGASRQPWRPNERMRSLL